MKRAAVLIGVDKTGHLPKLSDAAKSARRVEEWARSQRIDPVTVLTDEGGRRLVLQDVKDAVSTILKKGVTEQLIVYFAGHGVNIGYAEQWLLTDAPEDTNAAVNLNGSAEIAHHSDIPHVVFISDACRTAAEGITAQAVDGGEIFPSVGGGGPEGAVDRFWACLVGDPAAEIRDPNTTAAEYRALYTEVVLDALHGQFRRMLRRDGGDRVVRPRPLKLLLSKQVPLRIKDLALKTKLIQVPDARITSEDSAWISRIAGTPAPETGAPSPPPPARPPTLPIRKGPRAAPAVRAAVPHDLESVSRLFVQSAASGPPSALKENIQSARAAGLTGVTLLADAFEQTSEPFGPRHFESQCGFKARGVSFLEAFSRNAQAFVISGDRTLIRINGVTPPGASVLLLFEGGAATVLPAIPDFIGALTFEAGRLVDVSYEPSDNSWRWDDFLQRAPEVRALRAIAASATRSGVFRLDGNDALAVAQRMQYAKGVDPTLAIYAAYAYGDIRRRERIRRMSRYMRDDLGGRFFDIAMLAGELDDQRAGADPLTLSFFPLLAQGWSLLSAHRISLPPALGTFRRTLLPSVWTMFSADGVGNVRSLIQTGEVT